MRATYLHDDDDALDDDAHELIREANARVVRHTSSSHDEEELQESYSKEVGHAQGRATRRWLRALGLLLGAAVLVFAVVVVYANSYGAASSAPGEEPSKPLQQYVGPKAPPPFWRTGPLQTPEQAAAEAALQAKKDAADEAVRASGEALREQVKETKRHWAEQEEEARKKKEVEAKAAADAQAAAAAEEERRKKEEEQAAAQKKKEQEAAAAAAAQQKKEEEEKAAAEAAAAAAAAAPPSTEDGPDEDEDVVDETEEIEELMPLVEARRLAEAACKEMEMDYGVDDAKQLFGSLHFRNRDVIKRKLARAILKEDKFVVSFAGTSVTAGHDNLFEESYPLVFGRALQPVFEAAGIDLVVRNHAMGNNPAIPSAFCVGAQLGEDTDVAVWEFGMMVGGPLMLPHIELWLRNALALPRRPALMFLDPGEGARKPDSEGKLPTEPRPGTPGDWSAGGFGQGDQDLLAYYEAFAPHAQAMYEAVWTLDHTERYNFQALVNTGKSTARPAGWHPGPGGHELRGRILAYHYLRLLDDALADAYDAKAADIKAGSGRKEQDKLVAAADADAAAPIPRPLHCDPVVCSAPTRCALTYEPRAEGWGLQEKLVQAPEEAKTAVPTLEAGDNGKWHVQLYAPDHEAVSYAKSEGFGYLDLKYVLQGDLAAGPLTLKVATTKKQRFYLCQPPPVWNRTPEDQGQLHEDAALTVDGVEMKLLPLDDAFYNQHKLEAKVCFAAQREVEAGEHTLVLTPTHQGKYVALAVVVWY